MALESYRQVGEEVVAFITLLVLPHARTLDVPRLRVTDPNLRIWYPALGEEATHGIELARVIVDSRVSPVYMPPEDWELWLRVRPRLMAYLRLGPMTWVES